MHYSGWFYVSILSGLLSMRSLCNSYESGKPARLYPVQDMATREIIAVRNVGRV
jgi:hypothetical protein